MSLVNKSHLQSRVSLKPTNMFLCLISSGNVDVGTAIAEAFRLCILDSTASIQGVAHTAVPTR